MSDFKQKKDRNSCHVQSINKYVGEREVSRRYFK